MSLAGVLKSLPEPLQAIILDGVERLHAEVQAHPVHVFAEILFALFILYLLSKKPFKPQKKPEKLLEKEVDELIRDWNPEPLIPGPASSIDEKVPILETAAGARTIVAGHKGEVINMASFNFLGLVGNKQIESACEGTITKYGVGSCGPRGFYGTIDVHLELEEKVAKFMGVDEAILYSYGFATIASVIPAFSKRDDLIVCDSGVSFSTATGIDLSRSPVQYFKHNDMADLERILQAVKEKDRKHPPKQLNRRFIVVEGVYVNHGDIVPLNKVLELAAKYCFRIIMDDSFGFGALGKTGRGTCEHFGVPVTSIDLLTVDLGTSLASVGGFCIGSHLAVNHQRLSGAGYCFSASLPPFLAVAGTEGIKYLEQNPTITSKLAENSKLMLDELSAINSNKNSILRLEAQPNSPIFHLRLNKPAQQRQEDEEKLQSLVDRALANGVLLTRSKYCTQERAMPSPSIRICVSAAHTAKDVKKAADQIKALCQ